MNALTEEAVLPTLHNLILAEVYLSGGPVDVFRLWSEMYERQKTIDVGTLLFVRAIAHLEENGFLQKVSESKSALTEQGRAYLIALLLAGSLSDEALDRLAESGLKLASTGNILDVAPQQEEHPTKAVTYADGTGVVANRKPSIHTNSDTHLIRQNSIIYRGVAVSPAAPQVLGVADRATGNAPVTDGLQVGDEGGGEILSSSPLYLLASEIVDVVTKGYEQ